MTDDHLAVAAVLTTLRKLLREKLTDGASELNPQVTLLPPAKAAALSGNRVNLFLYEVRENAAARNTLPPGLPPGSRMPLAVDLHIMLSVHTDSEPAGERALMLLGAAALVLHDSPVLRRVALDTSSGTPEYTYPYQDTIRVTALNLSSDELAKVWGAFKDPAAPLLAYRAGAVVMESRRPATSSLPVTKLGPDERGPTAAADAASPFPEVDEVRVGGPEAEKEARRRPRSRPVFEPGETVRVRGRNLKNPRVKISGPGVTAPDFVAAPVGDGEFTVVLDADRVNVPGRYRMVVDVVGPGGPRLTAPEITFDLAPRFLVSPLVQIPPGAEFATVSVARRRPTRLLQTQRYSLLLAGTELQGVIDPGPPPALTFRVPRACPEGKYVVRLRVDGVDSLPQWDGDKLLLGEPLEVRHVLG